MARPSVGRWFESLKGPTFTAREVRVFCVLVLCVAPIALIFVLSFGHHLAPNEDIAGLGGDFPAFFLAGRILNEYGPSKLYDLQLQERLFLEVCPDAQGLRLPYLHPPHLAVVFRLFALLPYGWAFAAWSAVSLTMYVAGLLVMFRRFGPVNKEDSALALLLGLSFQPFLVETLAGGQLSSIGFLCLALALTNEHRGRYFLSGVFVSLCAYTPTLLVLPLPMIVISRRWRALLGLAAGIAALSAFSLMVAGTSVLVDYIRTTIYFGRLYAGSEGVLRTWKFIDFRAFATLLTGSHTVGLLVAVVVASVAVPRLIRAWWLAGIANTRYSAGAWTQTLAWMLLLNFYVPVYDGILIVLVIILMAHTPNNRSNMLDEPAFQWLMFLTIVTPWISQIIARVCGLQMFTLVLVLVAFYADRLVEATRAARASVA
jgi:hypothetical protein